MRVFLTGASGYIGGAVLARLLREGHQVTVLARSPERAAALKARGASVLVADLADTAAWRRGAEASDALIHAASERSPERVRKDRAAIEALVAARETGMAGAFLYASGAFNYGDTGGRPVGDNGSVARPHPLLTWRPAHDELVQAAGGVAVRGGTVYGGGRGTLAVIFREAAERGRLTVVGQGGNHVALVHTDDLADLFCLLLDGSAAGRALNATDGSRLTQEQLIGAVARAFGGLPVEHVSVEEASERLGPFASTRALDQVIESPGALALGWRPRHVDAAAEMETLVAEWRANQ